MKTLNIIGAGAVGKVLGSVFSERAIFQVQDVLNSSKESSIQAVSWMGCGHPVSAMRDMRVADVTMLTVPDDSIGAVCQEWIECGLATSGTILFHCSGALSSLDLVEAQNRGVLVASAHPIRSFAHIDRVATNFSGTFFGVEGNSSALDILKRALSGIDAEVVLVKTDMKTLYHAASVLACNHVTALIDLALNLYQVTGIPEQKAYQLAEPLITETIQNIFRSGAAQALSGPVARGDWNTVKKQQMTMDAVGAQAGEVYRVLTQLTQQLALRKKGT